MGTSGVFTLLKPNKKKAFCADHCIYPTKFTVVHRRQRSKGDPISRAIEETVYIRLAFKGDHFPNGMGHKLSLAVNPTFPAADLHILPITRRIILNQSEYLNECYSLLHI